MSQAMAESSGRGGYPNSDVGLRHGVMSSRASSGATRLARMTPDDLRETPIPHGVYAIRIPPQVMWQVGLRLMREAMAAGDWQEVLRLSQRGSRTRYGLQGAGSTEDWNAAAFARITARKHLRAATQPIE